MPDSVWARVAYITATIAAGAIWSGSNSNPGMPACGDQSRFPRPHRKRYSDTRRRLIFAL